MISVIVPVYNTKEYLLACVDSILGQSFTDLEVILVDDGSTDGSELLCDSLHEKDNRVTVVHSANFGVASARNIGLDSAKGEFFCFVDSDDYIHKDLLKTLFFAIEKENADMAMAYIKEVNCFNKEFSIINPDMYTVKNQEDFWSLRYSENASAFQLYMCPAKLYRKRSLNGLRFHNGKRQEDLFWFADYASLVTRVVVYEADMYYYFQRNNSNMHSPSYINFLYSLQANYYLAEECSKRFPQFINNEKIVFYRRYFHHLSILRNLTSNDAKKLKRYFRKRYHLDKKYLKNGLTIGQQLVLIFLNIESVGFVIKMMDYHYDIFEYIRAHL